MNRKQPVKYYCPLSTQPQEWVCNILCPSAAFWMKIFLLLVLTTLSIPSLPDHFAKTFTAHHSPEKQSEDGGSIIALETSEDTVAQPNGTVSVPTTTATATSTTMRTTTTSTTTPTTIIPEHPPVSETPAPTIVLVLDNSNNNSRPALHRAGTFSKPQLSGENCECRDNVAAEKGVNSTWHKNVKQS